jgi:hypothetical protein
MAVRAGLLAAFVAAAFLGAPARGRGGVSVNVGIELPAPAPLAAIPGTGVMYAPAVPGNYFFYDARYWVFTGGAWYVSAGYDGPWGLVAPALVPAPILAVPVRYYRVLPREWRAWRLDAPPRWDARWGRRRVERERPRDHARRHETYRPRS